MRRPSFPDAAAVFVAILIGTAGGALFHLADLPAAWLSGAMVAVGAATLSGFRARVPSRMRDVVFALLGISMGAGVTPDVVERMGLWPISLVALCLTVAVVGAAVYLWLKHGCGWDRDSAFFASVPGALSFVMILADRSKADLARVALSQSMRVFLLVAVLPSAILWLEHEPGAAVLPPMAHSADLGGVLLQIGLGAAGGWLAVVVGVPGGGLIGAFVASALVHLTGLVDGGLPAPLQIAGFVVLGSFVGLRFAGSTWRSLGAALGPGIGAFAIGLVAAAAGALATSAVTGLPIGQTMIAFAPGGLEAMMILSFTLDLDPAYVAAHQLARFLLMMAVLPVVARIVLGRDWNKRPD
ncbi:AbrB family transcriptional regulator [Methylobrevis albus]|uniref:AbrB family transcriptional regulator n=1 Tax=Methylobrevis albus TaxID=2793297 RepID=A0A931MXZ0_9HYPH|nr:AbrB family transcriptional regulator [Methylobrevis albus]MBH0237475.1 AbrB family transcriptional regulator [Methylobrevis albus]